MATRLPGDVKRYLALTKDMSLRKILDLCQLNKEYNRDICNNLAFWQAIAQQRYNYTLEQTRAMTLEQLKQTIKDSETAYTVEEGLDLINRIRWTVGRNDLEDITVGPPTEGYVDRDLWSYPAFTDPEIQAMMLKKINFGKPLILYVEDFTDFDPNDQDRGEGPDLELELPAIISPMEIIGALANYYETERQRLGLEGIEDLMGNHIFFEDFYPYRNGYNIGYAS